MNGASTKLYNVLMGNPGVNNGIGRTAGSQAAMQNSDNFFVKRGKSIENALGTTAAAGASLFKSGIDGIGGMSGSGAENIATQELLRNTKQSMNDIAQKYGYNSWNDWQDAYYAAKEAGDTAKVAQMEPQLKEFQAQANANAKKADEKAAAYKDYTENNYISKKINQDRGKFAGSAINTMSTALDVTGLTANPLANAVQGGVEGIADELEQNGLQDFSWERAGQNALIGATTGAVTGALNKGISSSLAKRAAAKGLANTATEAGLGQVLKQGAKTIASGAARGALSGAVGGATGAGLQSALNGVEFGQGVQNALQGAVQGAQQGAVTGGIMAGANMAISKTPGVGKFYNELQGAKSKWDQSGSNFDERLTNTLTSGDSAFGDWLMNKRQSNVLGAAGSLGNRVQDVKTSGYKPLDENDLRTRELTSNWSNGNYKNIDEFYRLHGNISDFDNMTFKNNTTGEVITGADLRNSGVLSKLYSNADFRNFGMGANNGLGGASSQEEFNLYINNDSADNLANVVKEWTDWQPTRDWNDARMVGSTPTTAKGWAKKAGQRIVEDINNKGVGLGVRDVSSDMPEDIRNMQIRDYNANADEPYSQQKSVGKITFDTSTTSDGKTSGLDRTIQAFNNSGNQELVSTRGGKQFVIGDYGADAFSRKAVKPDRISLSDVADVINNSTRQYVAGDDGFRKDNVAWVGETKNGDTAVVYTRLNNAGQEEIINGHLINSVPTYEQTLSTYGTPAQSRTGSLGLEDLGAESAAQGRKSIITQDNVNVNVQDPWDRVAREAGYNNYDEVIQRYMKANPNTPLNQNGAAGQILTWLDQNPNAPTTAGEWAKLAGQRIAEDVNNRGVGLGIRDVSRETPETELYRRLNGNGTAGNADAIQEADVVPSKTSKEGKMRYAQGKELLSQYGSVDQPMARASRAVESVQEIANAGFTKPEDVERMANVITGSNGEVSKLTRNLIKSAMPVNTFEGDNGQTIEEFIDNSIDLNSLYGTNAGAAVKRTIEANMRSLPSRAEGSVTYTDNPEDVFRVVQNLEASAAELEGRGGNTYHRPTIENIHQASVLKDTANMLKDRLYDGVDVKQALTPEVAANLKSYDPKNKDWVNYVDNKIMNAESVSDLRSVQAPWVRMSKYIDNAYTQAATVGGRMVNNANDLSRILTTRNGLLRAGIDALWNSNAAKRGRASVYGKMADKAAAETPTTATDWAKQAGKRVAEDLGNTNLGNRVQDVNGTMTGNNTPNGFTEFMTTTDNNPSTRLYNAIGRTEGLSNAEQARTAQYITDATAQANATDTYTEPLAAAISSAPTTNVETAQNVATPVNNTPTSLYDSIYGATATTMPTTTPARIGYFDATGDYWTDVLARAMTSAIDADDVTAFASLYGMYQNALSKNSSGSSGKDYSDPTNWSSADRTKLLNAQNALDQIDQLEQAYVEATGEGGSNAVQGWLRSRAADISGGNWDPSASNYNNLAESVGMSIIKNLINLGVTEADAERYKKYIPSITDTKEQATMKLETLRNIYQNQINNLYSAYGL